MKKLAICLGTSALLFAVVDAIHGQDNGDVHRFYIHLAEFVLWLSFIAVMELQAYREIAGHLHLNAWFAGGCLSFASCIGGFALFGLAGGSAHGDGGPLAVVFGLTGCIGMLCIPVCLVGALVTFILRKRAGQSTREVAKQT